MYAFVQDVPIDEGFYQQIMEGLGTERPNGLVAHVAVKRPEGGLRYIDVWESEQDWDRFAEERLHPIVHSLLHGVFGPELPPEPERVPVSVVHVWGRADLFG